MFGGQVGREGGRCGGGKVGVKMSMYPPAYTGDPGIPHSNMQEFYGWLAGFQVLELIHQGTRFGLAAKRNNMDVYLDFANESARIISARAGTFKLAPEMTDMDGKPRGSMSRKEIERHRKIVYLKKMRTTAAS